MNTEKVGKVIKIVGLTFTGACMAFLILWSCCSSGAKKPLEKGENNHWQDPTEQK